MRTLNTRSSFILLQLLDLFTTLAAFRAGGFELNPLVASLTVHFGRVGGILLSKVIAVFLMLGVRRRLWMVNLFYIGVICWNVVVVVSLLVRKHSRVVALFGDGHLIHCCPRSRSRTRSSENITRLGKLTLKPG